MIPLCVDLDGTLIKEDSSLTLIKKFFARRPIEAFFKCIIWSFSGRAYVKQKLAREVDFEVQEWTIIKAVVDYVRQAKSEGRYVYLVTGTDLRVAKTISQNMNLFDDTYASDGRVNLVHIAKMNMCISKFGEYAYDYIGNSKDDIIVWKYAKTAILSPLTPENVRKKIKEIHGEKVIEL